MKVKKLVIDYSTLSTWRTCPSKFNYRYVQQLTGKSDSEALVFGSLVHRGLERIYRDCGSVVPTDGTTHEIDYLGSGNIPSSTNDPLTNALHWIAAEAAKTCIGTTLPDNRRSIKHLLTLLTAYFKNYFPDPLVPSRFESFHKVALTDRISFCGTVDGIVDTIPAVFETKTTSFLNSNFLERLNPNDQATGYCVLASDLLGKPVRTIVFNGISTSGYGMTPGALTSKPDKWMLYREPARLFLRAETHRSDADIEDWLSRLLRDCNRIIEDIESDTFSKNGPDSCTIFNSTCSFIDLCRTRKENVPILIQNTMKVEPWKGCTVEVEA